MTQSPLLEFESNAFSVEPGEDARTNPGVFGKALATWLSAQLQVSGSRTGDLIAEDFGWCIPVESKPHRLFVVCASDGESSTAWRVFVFAEGGLLSRLLGTDQSARSVSALFGAVKQVLASSPKVTGLREEEA
jgi:hypothetical protein